MSPDRLRLLLSAAFALALTPALAQSAAPPSDYLRTSCSADFKRLCGKVTPGKGRAAACMREKEAELSADCRTAMNSPEGQAQRDRY